MKTAGHKAPNFLCSSGGRSYTNPISNLVYLDCIDLESDFIRLNEGRFSAQHLPTVLHEFSHHECLNSSVGNALTLLYMHAQLNALKGDQNLGAYQYHTYLSAALTLRPILEGLALFTEHDLSPHNEFPSSAPMLLAWVMATRYYPQAIHQQVLLSKLFMARWLHNDKKEDLFSRSISSTNGGYFLGYSMVRTAWLEACKQDAFFNNPENFYTYVQEFLLNDYELVSILLKPPAGTSDFSIKDVVATIANHIIKRLERFLFSNDLAEFRQKAEAYKRSYDDSGIDDGRTPGKPKLEVRGYRFSDPSALLFNDAKNAKKGVALMSMFIKELDRNNAAENKDIHAWKNLFKGIWNRRRFFLAGTTNVKWEKTDGTLILTLKNAVVKFPLNTSFENNESGTANLQVHLLSTGSLFAFVLVGKTSKVILNEGGLDNHLKALLLDAAVQFTTLKSLDEELESLEKYFFIDTSSAAGREKLMAEIYKHIDNVFGTWVVNKLVAKNSASFIKESQKYGLLSVFEDNQHYVEALSAASLIGAGKQDFAYFAASMAKFDIEMEDIHHINSIFQEKYGNVPIAITENEVSSIW